MFRFKTTLSILSICALTLVSCAPEDGETGPAGPIGPEGQIGPKGDPGVDGVANISVSTFFISSSDWTLGTTYRDTLDVSAITQDVMDNGTVQVFQTESANDPQWGDLPFSYLIGINGGASEVTIQAEHALGKIYLSVINDVGANIASNPNYPGDRSFKVVVIPPSARKVGVDHSNYEELDVVYGIEKLNE